MLGVSRPDLDQVTVVARDMVNLHHLGALRQRAGDRVVTGRLLAPNRHKGEEPLVQRARVEQGRIAANDPPSLELANPLHDGRRRQANDPGNLCLRFARVQLKQIQYLSVFVVYCSVESHDDRILRPRGRGRNPTPGRGTSHAARSRTHPVSRWIYHRDMKPEGEDAPEIAVAPRPLEEMWGELGQRVAAVRDPWIARLLGDVIAAQESKLRIWPAAVTVHHAYRGGLLEHILSVAAIAGACAERYEIDGDLLFAGVVLHDIGKLEELAYGECTTYTRDGNLIGHIALGLAIVREAIGRIDGFPPELRARLEHMIVSHHGSRQLGSPVEPMTEEAFVLSAIDDLDARLHQVRRHQREGGTEAEFTPYHPRLKRVLFKPGVR